MYVCVPVPKDQVMRFLKERKKNSLILLLIQKSEEVKSVKIFKSVELKQTQQHKNMRMAIGHWGGAKIDFANACRYRR